MKENSTGQQRRNGIAVLRGFFDFSWPIFLMIPAACQLFPDQCSQISQFLSFIVPETILKSSYINADLVSSFSGEELATAFFSSRLILFFWSAFCFILYSFIFLSDESYRRGMDKMNFLRQLLAAVFVCAMGFHLFFSGDFFFVSDGDYSGAFRPPFGLYIHAFATFSITGIASLLCASLVVRLRGVRDGAK